MNDSTALAAVDFAPPTGAKMNEREVFELDLRKAKLLSSSTLVPAQYQGNVANAAIALNMARRIGADPLMVCQNLFIVQGKPGWSGQFLIATFNSCGRFTAMKFEWDGKPGDKDWRCRAYATEKETGERITGSWVTWAMAQAEGWTKKAGSKWLTMPEVMATYRAGAFLVRAYAPEIAMGLSTVEELRDTAEVDVTPAPTKTAAVTEALAAKLRPAAEVEHVMPVPGTDKELVITRKGISNRDRKPIPPADDSVAPPLSYAVVADRIAKASDEQLLEVAAEFIPAVANEEQRGELRKLVESRQAEFLG